MTQAITAGLVEMGLSSLVAGALAKGIGLAVLLLAGVVAYWITRHFLLRAAKRVVVRTPTRWDDMLQARKGLDIAANLVPALVVYVLTPFVFRGEEAWIVGVQHAALIYVILVGLWAVNALLNTVLDISLILGIGRQLPLTGLIQVMKLALVVLGAVLVVAVIINQTALYVLGGLGALSAVLMLVFKDPILGFAAGLQLTTNHLIARGDWIEMPRYDANGEVLEVGLTTVKVRNADKSITTIPTYSLISESFKNWRGMQEAGVRRIKRALLIDISSLRFCTEEMLEQYGRIGSLAPYIEEKRQEMAEAEASRATEGGSLLQYSALTNLGVFRSYVEGYLAHHPAIDHDLPVVVRQLAPTEFGLPLEVYAYCRETVWPAFEAIQADIFEHILAAVPKFHLIVFQYPGRTGV